MHRLLVDAVKIAASNPIPDITVESQMPGDMYWCLLHNNTNICWEVQDAEGRPYGEVGPYSQTSVRMKPKSIQMIFHEVYRITARPSPVVPRALYELSPDKNGDSILIVNA